MGKKISCLLVTETVFLLSFPLSPLIIIILFSSAFSEFILFGFFPLVSQVGYLTALSTFPNGI